MYSFSRVSTNNAGTFESISFCPVEFGDLAEFHFPNAMTCGFDIAGHSLQSMQTTTTIRSHVGKHFASMKADCRNVERCRYDA